MFPIDIVDIKKEVEVGHLKFYVKDNKIYCRNTIGETVKVGQTDKEVEE